MTTAQRSFEPFTPAPARANPFPGLRPFEASEAHLFFGREGQSDEVLRRLRLHRFVAVVGTSGSGKSSLVRAGLLPSLHSGVMVSAGSEWRVAVLRPGNDPIGHLAQALNAPDVLGHVADGDPLGGAFTEAVLRRGALGLVESVAEARLGPQENVLVVVDQFEEIFRLQRATGAARLTEDDGAAFVKLLLEATRQRQLPIYVVLTMRSDYLGDCAQYRDLPEAINAGQYLIPRLTREERRQAIVGPVAVGGGTIAPRLVNRLLNEVGDSPDQLPILQHALMRTWDSWSAHHASGDSAPGGPTAGEPIDIADYEAVGGMVEALSRHADEALADLSDARSRALAEKIFRRLTEKGPDNREIRRPTSLGEVCAIVEASEADVEAVVEVFRQPGRSFLMPPPPSPLRSESLIDISHESLIRGWGRLRQWVEDEAESAKTYRRLADTARRYAGKRAGLLRDPDLQVASDWWGRDRPNESWAKVYDPDFALASSFLSESKTARDAELAQTARQRRDRRRLALGAIGVLSVLLAASTFEWARARRQESEATRQRLTATQMRRIADSAKAGLAAKRDSLEVVNKRLVDQALSLRREALHVRSVERQNAASTIGYVDMLLSTAGPMEATALHFGRGFALSNSGQDSAAAQEYTRALETDSEYVAARINRSDVYLNQGKPALAVRDAEFVLQRSPHEVLGHLNRAVGLSILGQYDDAITAFANAIAGTRYTLAGASQSYLSPDIQRVTMLRSLTLSGPELRTALYYGRANVLAFSGRAGFEKALATADSQVPQMPDVYLDALNWAWFQRVRAPADYGALAAEGALWERAGFRDEALRAYDAFSREETRRRDPRYVALRQYVAGRWHTLNPTGAPVPPVVAETPDVSTLVLEADEDELRNDYLKAETALTQALALEPANVELLLRRAQIRLEHANTHPRDSDKYFNRTVADCNAALALQPSIAMAYFLRARVAYIRTRDSILKITPALRSAIVADLDRAIAADSTYASALINRAYILEFSDTAGALASLQRAVETVAPSDSRWYYRISVYERALQHTDRAMAAIRRALEINTDSESYYGARGRAEFALHWRVADVFRDAAAGWIAVADGRRKRGDESGADKEYKLAEWAEGQRFLAVVRRADSAHGSDSVRAVHELEDTRVKMTDAILTWKGSADSARAEYGRLVADSTFPEFATAPERRRISNELKKEIAYLTAAR